MGGFLPDKIRVLTIIPVKGIDKNGNDAVLEPGEYDATVNVYGTISTVWGGVNFGLRPLAIELIEAPEILVKLWEATVALKQAEFNYEQAKNNFENYTITP